MNEFEEPVNELERAISAAASADDAPEYPSRRQVLVALATNPITVMLAEPWDGTTTPENDPQPMLVSDGPNREQPMLAIFSSLERARDFQSRHGGAEYPSEVPAPVAILATPEGAGIMINPNQPLGFRLAPETAALLRRDVAAAIERAQAKAAENQ